eukprot:SAG22_NODE_33_length_27588_cov_104.174652_10_plen_160_part_00
MQYMLVEWVAALELQQRGTVKAVLPIIVGENDFYQEAHEAFGGVGSLPNAVSAKTMEKVVMHLGEITHNESTSALQDLLRQVSGQTEPTVLALISSLLRFQGVKLNQGQQQLSHGHGHLSVGMDDLGECTRRVQETVSSCIKQAGGSTCAASDVPHRHM